MRIEEEFERVLKVCEGLERHERDLLITGFLSDRLSRLILVGGSASAWYSRGSYRTLDVDVIAVGKVDELKKGLRKLGFERNRVWHYPAADYALDIVSRAGRPERTRTYEVNDYEIEIASPEEVIVNDLAGYKFWNLADDFDRAKLVFEAELENLDMDYLNRRASEENVADVLSELEQI
ncbi:hypothetical protein AKJ37_06060 [candidate division MSBL1 archaeon SCGC-AAA259I09]|uniref:Uncharacterized protein n=2 Tax=candidate division MSBL1 TaxID=215777 RepID=A0A133UPC8_9EURY|nr:hypothetical protein AKJ37_06060 [candidate division MSBL1 archaeon SCGC-AAA259I09]KXA97140.1 hypothetical protein AKJ39_03625 [candidate division MSBL1 archaeon SCGC-AAA259J03]